MSGGIGGRELRGAILFGALVYLGIRFIAQIADVLLIFSIVAILTIALSPSVSWLAARRVPRQVSAGALAIALLAAAAAPLYFLIPPAVRQLEEIWRQTPGLLDHAQQWLRQFAAAYPALADHVPKDLTSYRETISQAAGSLLGGVTRVTASAAGILAGVFLIGISTVYSLARPDPLVNGLLSAFAPTHRDRARAAGERLTAQIRAWARGVVVAMIAVFFATWVGLAIVGVEQALLFAVIAGVFEAVPIVGPVISAIPPVLVALALGDPTMALWIVVVFVVVQQLENHVLIPLIMSHQLSLHPVTVIFAVLVMGGLFGIVGVLLATPAAAAVGILYDEFHLRNYQPSLTTDPADEPDAPT